MTRLIVRHLFATTVVLVLGLYWSDDSQAQGLIYVDADDGFVSGNANIAPLSEVESLDFFVNDDKWGFREFASDGTIFVTGDGAQDGVSEDVNFENAAEITQTLSGLTPNTSYDVYVVYWSATNAEWGIRAGFATNPGGNQYFNRTGANVDGAQGAAGIPGGAAVWTTLPGPNSDANVFTEGDTSGVFRQLYLGKVGTQLSNGSGQLPVFIDDVSTEEFNQSDFVRTWFDGLAYVETGDDVVVQATINRDTGSLNIDFNNASGIDVASYSITSAAGELDPNEWNSIATGSNSALDSDPWVESSSTVNDLSEAESPAVDGFNLNSGLSLGDVWIRSPFEDVQVELTLTDASVITLTPAYSGTAVTFGSFDSDDDIDEADFAVLMANMFTDVSSFTPVESYFLGDVTGDLAIDFDDFAQFETLFDAANGPGSFAALQGASVPEPNTIALATTVCVAVIGWFVVRRLDRLSFRNYSISSGTSFVSRHQDSSFARFSMVPVRLSAVLIAYSLLAVPTTPTLAVQIAQYEFEGDLSNSVGVAGNAFESEGAFPDSGATFTNGLVTDSIRGDVFDLSGGGVGGDGSNGGLNLTLPVGGNATGSWTLDMWIRDTAGSVGYLFDNRATAAGTAAGGDSLILNLGQSNQEAVSLFDGVAWRNPGTPDVDDGGWHHIAWVYDGVADIFTGYVDGLAGSTPVSVAIGRDLLFENIELGNEGAGGGGGGQEGRLIDDVGVFSRALTAEEIAERAAPMTLDLIVDTTDGTASIENNQLFPFTFNFYQISSGTDAVPGSSLSTSGWNSLDDQEGADPPGTGWVEGGGSNSSLLGEGNVTGSLTLNPGESRVLGALFDTSVGVEDLTFRFSLEDNPQLVPGIVQYVPDDMIDPPGGLDGDYNDDGIVNIADYTVWRDALGIESNSAQRYHTRYGSCR